MRIYNRTNIPETVAVAAASFVVKHKPDPRIVAEKISDSLYYISMSSYPTLKLEIGEDKDVIITLIKDDE